jgi:hypothetical protein
VVTVSCEDGVSQVVHGIALQYIAKTRDVYEIQSAKHSTSLLARWITWLSY